MQRVWMVLAALFLAPGAAFAGAGIVLWESTGDALQGWGTASRLEASNQDGLLRLVMTAPDAWLTRDGLSFEPSPFDTLLIRYRASGFDADKTSGEVFYANEQHRWGDTNYIHVPSLELDGEWHDLLLPVRNYLRSGLEDWVNGGVITALRLDLVNQAPGAIEISSMFLTPGLRTIEADDVHVAAPRRYFLKTESFQSTPEKTWSRELVLPAASWSVWAHILDVPAGRESLGSLQVNGQAATGPTGDVTGRQAWFRVANVEGGAIAFTLGSQPGVFFDALLIAEGTNPPRDLPEHTPAPVVSTIRPLERTGGPIRRPYWTGSMLSYPGKLNLSGASTFFRRVFGAGQALESAWLQLSVDDRCRAYVNGTEIVEGVAESSWMNPACVDVTALLKAGQQNVVAVEAINAGGPGGMLADLTLNYADQTSEKLVSDESWRCSLTGPEGWTAPGFDDAAWPSAETHPAPPNAPWTAEVPYQDKTWQAPTELLSVEFAKTLAAGESQQIALVLRSETPFKPTEAGVVRLVNAEGGRVVVEKELVLEEAGMQTREDGSTAVSGITVPISRWYPAMTLRIEVALYGRTLRVSPETEFTFAVTNTMQPEALESHVETVAGAPRLIVNGTPVYPMVGNGEGRNRPGTRAAYMRAGFNIEANWIDGMGSEQWWLGPGEYAFEPVDRKIIEALDTDPELWMLPIIWAAPPLWWEKANPDEMARFNDGEQWHYYRSAHSFASEKWREDAAEALTAFVQHVESMPYASRVLGYWVIGGVSAEWQGWGCHSSHANEHLMDYSAPAEAGFRAFLQTKHPQRTDWPAESLIPSFEERIASEFGVFRDPRKAALSIDYVEFYSESMADAILHCAGAVKAAMNREKIVGAYFGYSMEYTNMMWALQMSGHNRLRKVLDSPDIDFLSAPPSYSVRRIGEPMGWMWPWRSIQNAGKLVWVDDDTRTYLAGVCGYHPAVNPEHTEQVLRRNFATALCRRAPIGFLAINSGLELDSPAIARDARIAKRVGEYLVENAVQRQAEIAVIIDEDSAKYLQYAGDMAPSGDVDRNISWNGDTGFVQRQVMRPMGDLVSYQRERIARIGAPADWMLLSDLERSATGYKLYLMLSCFQYDEAALEAVTRKLYGKPCVVVWFYAPGFIHNGSADVAHMQRLIGMTLGIDMTARSLETNIVDFRSPFTDSLRTTSFGAPYAIAPRFHVTDPAAKVLGVYRDGGQASLAVKDAGAARSVFCGATKPSVELLRNLARAAGVHVYTESGDAFDANDRFLLLHTSAGGVKTVRLHAQADVVDVFEGTLLFENATEFSLTVPAEETRFLYTGDAAVFQEFMAPVW